jgi:hypothetical protein
MERRSPADFARGLALSQKHLGYLEITNNLINGDSFLTRSITLRQRTHMRKPSAHHPNR